MREKSLILIAGFISFLTLDFACLHSADAAQTANLPKRISFASHKVGTSNNAITTALCKVASERSGILVVVQPTGGASAWISPMNNTGIPELGFAHIQDIWWGYSGKVSPEPLPGNPLGTKPFYPPSPNLRSLIAGPRLMVGLICKADAPFKSLRDAKGSRLAGGYAAQISAYSSVVACFANEGLVESEFKVVTVPGAAAGVTALMEGRVDLASASIGMPVVSEANARVGVRFLPLSTKPEDVKAVAKVFPGSTVAVRQPGPPGVKEPTALMNYPLMVTTSTHLPDHVAYALVKTWWDNHKETWTLHPACKDWSPKDFVIKNVTVPYHPGAIKFYKENGAWGPEMDQVQERLLKGEYPFLDY